MSMRIALAVILATIVGVATGVGMAVLRVQIAPWDGDPGGVEADPQMPAVAQSGQPMPKLVIDQLEYHYGTMDVDDKRSHDFVFTNTGNARLVLSAGGTSCRCAVSSIEDTEVLPGRSTTVTLTWTSGETIGPSRRTATILTNDPDRKPWCWICPRTLYVVCSGCGSTFEQPKPVQVFKESPRCSFSDTAAFSKPP